MNSIKALLVVATAAFGTASLAHAGEDRLRVVTAPSALPVAHDRPRVFLGGSIDLGSAPDWQKRVIAELSDEKVLILNPRRANWDPEWRLTADDPNFRQQVDWELGALESADVIVLYLSPGSQSPISLLEMGLYARTGKLIVLCPEGYWRKGNVDITARRYKVEQVASFDGLIAAIKKRIAR